MLEHHQTHSADNPWSWLPSENLLTFAWCTELTSQLLMTDNLWHCSNINQIIILSWVRPPSTANTLISGLTLAVWGREPSYIYLNSVFCIFSLRSKWWSAFHAISMSPEVCVWYELKYWGYVWYLCWTLKWTCNVYSVMIKSLRVRWLFQK